MNWEERKKWYDKEYFDIPDSRGPYEAWWWKADIIWQPRAQLIQEAFNPKTVLDCGCAKGSLVKFLIDIDIDAYGFDLSKYAINSCPFPDIKDKLLLLDVAENELPFPKWSMDISVCFDFFEHNDDEHIGIVCQRIMDVTRQYIIIRQPLVAINEIDVRPFHRKMIGTSVMSRMAQFAVEFSFPEIHKNAENTEHPNTLPRTEIIALFPEFEEVILQPRFYDMCHGVDEEASPIIPFYDTIILIRK